MGTQVKIISGCTETDELESRINTFLESKQDIDIIQIELTTYSVAEIGVALIHYKKCQL